MCTLISQFYNEEFLLPFWLKHHQTMFDHGILINYASTDNSVSIIRELCPSWEVIPSQYTYFDPHTNDMEIMEVEQRVSGWKMSLNTTEFLFTEDLKYYLKDKNYNGMTTQGIIMVESLEESKIPINQKPLFKQRHYGFWEPPEGYLNMGRPSRSRLIHRYPHGMYHLGRHVSNVPGIYHDKDFLLLWFGYCPFDVSLKRKAAINSRFLPGHQDPGFFHENWTNSYHHFLEKSHNLFEIPRYKEIYTALNKCKII